MAQLRTRTPRRYAWWFSIVTALATSEARCSGDTAVSHRLTVSPRMANAEYRTVVACNGIGSSVSAP